MTTTKTTNALTQKQKDSLIPMGFVDVYQKGQDKGQMPQYQKQQYYWCSDNQTHSFVINKNEAEPDNYLIIAQLPLEATLGELLMEAEKNLS
jgi:hypothetical protein